MSRNSHFFCFFAVLLFLTLVIECNSQSDKMQAQDCIDREAVVAGSFYSNDSTELRAQLKELFSQAVKTKTHGEVLAIISPHAGYVYSGKVAASAYNQVNTDKQYENIFILTASHREVFAGASIYNKGDYITPLGKAKVNIDLANKLIEENKIFIHNSEAHAAEHSLEVQLPFLQYILGDHFKMIPIVTGTQNLHDVKQIAKVLKPYFNEKNLFIVSTDFSHYPKYEDAVKVDKRTGDAVLANSVSAVLNAIKENSSAQVENLLTSLCGWPAVLTVLSITEQDRSIEVTPVDYQNSGDAVGDKSRVVGYHAIAFEKKKMKNMSEDQFIITDEEKRKLLGIARNTIDEYLATGSYSHPDQTELTKTLKLSCGAFVTLHKQGQLRGCIGRFVADEPLYEIVQKMSIAAATEDRRFSRVEPHELKELDLEISVLTPLKKIDSIDEIEMGRHGIYIKKGFASGTFLPQVAIETGWTKEEFLGYCARNKAGLGWDGWKDADIYIYEALVFDEDELKK